MSVLALVSLLGCVPIRPSGTHASTAPVPAPSAPAPPAAEPDALAADRVAFGDRVLPILRDRCSPCHFEGGTMYDRLPFDQPATIRVLGTALFSRIRNEEERQAIREFLGISAPAPAGEADAP
jgi:hypothetical protein